MEVFLEVSLINGCLLFLQSLHMIKSITENKCFLMKIST